MKNTIKLKKYKTTNFEKSLINVSIDHSMATLPLIHKVDSVRVQKTNLLTAIDYFNSGIIDPIPCNVFGEELIYTYIGRPSYLELNLPTCFVIKPAPELIQNIFIFDSGAYFDNLYKTVVDNKLDINLFRIPANIDMIKRFISLYFGDNTFYYFGLAKNSNQTEIMNSVEEFDYSMLQEIIDFNRAHFDSRCRTIENIIRSSIDLSKYLQAVIIPKSLSINDTFEYFRKNSSTNFDIMIYNDNYGNTSKNICNKQIDCILLHYFQKNGYISI